MAARHYRPAVCRGPCSPPSRRDPKHTSLVSDSGCQIVGPTWKRGRGDLAIRGRGGTFTLGAWRGLVWSRPLPRHAGSISDPVPSRCQLSYRSTDRRSFVMSEWAWVTPLARSPRHTGDNSAKSRTSTLVCDGSLSIWKSRNALQPVQRAACCLRIARASVSQEQGIGRGGKRAGIDLSFHSLRHTAVSLLKDAGVPDAVVMARSAMKARP